MSAVHSTQKKEESIRIIQLQTSELFYSSCYLIFMLFDKSTQPTYTLYAYTQPTYNAFYTKSTQPAYTLQVYTQPTQTALYTKSTQPTYTLY